MRTVIQGFPGVGKTHLSLKDPSYIDLDSKLFNGLVSWPFNYLKEISEVSNKPNIKVLCATYPEVSRGLDLSPIESRWTIFPSLEMKDEMMKRYEDRNSSQRFLDVMDINYEFWITSLMIEQTIKMNINSIFITLEPGLYLSDLIGNFE